MDTDSRQRPEIVRPAPVVEPPRNVPEIPYNEISGKKKSRSSGRLRLMSRSWSGEQFAETADSCGAHLDIVISSCFSVRSQRLLLVARVFRSARCSPPLPALFNPARDSGFVPSTTAEDGDPLDVIVIHDQRLPRTGAGLPHHGILKIQQKSKGKAEQKRQLSPYHGASHSEAGYLATCEAQDRIQEGLEKFFIASG